MGVERWDWVLTVRDLNHRWKNLDFIQGRKACPKRFWTWNITKLEVCFKNLNLCAVYKGEMQGR